MGSKLSNAYNIAEREGGMPAKMRLAAVTGIPSGKAATEPDSPDLIQKFESALNQVLGKPVKL